MSKWGGDFLVEIPLVAPAMRGYRKPVYEVPKSLFFLSSEVTPKTLNLARL